MIVLASAMKGIMRCLEYTKAQAESESTLYTRGAENLLKIRDLACQIVETSNLALAKVGLDEVKYMDVRSQYYEDSIQNTAKINALFMKELLTEFELVPKNFESDKSTFYEKTNVELTDVEDNSVSNVVPERSKGFKSIETHKEEKKAIKEYKKHKELLKSNNVVPEDFCRVFKKITSDTAHKDVNMFSDPQMKRFASLVNNYFNVRFDARYDINNIHKFDRTQFRNYLASFVLAYGQSFDWGDNLEFLDECESWLNEVKSGHIKYTFPKRVASIFFSIKNRNIDSVLSEKSLENARRIYDELWLLGYEDFESQYEDDTLMPQFRMGWLDFDKVCIKYVVPGETVGNFWNIVKCNAIELFGKVLDEVLDHYGRNGNFNFA